MRRATAAFAMILTALLGSSAVLDGPPSNVSADGLPRCCV
jgi:hypothetical protein